ncbi:hypothetical protein [Duganella caerulea]
MFQTHTVTPPCICKPAAPRPAPVPTSKYSAELMRMFAQLVMLR